MGIQRGDFLTSANAAIQRGPAWFVEAPYQAFLSGFVVGRPDTWAGLFVSGELIFGLVLALGLFTPIAAWGTLWLSANIILEKNRLSRTARTSTRPSSCSSCSVSRRSVGWHMDWTPRYDRTVPAGLASTLIGPATEEPPRPAARTPLRVPA